VAFTAHSTALADTGAYGRGPNRFQDILDRRRRVLGDDHPDTLTSADNLAIILRALGETSDDVP